MASANRNRPYSNLIVTPDMVPPDPEPFETLAADYNAKAAYLDQLQQQAVAANTLREDAAQSPGFEVGHQKNREWAADIGRGASWFHGASEAMSNMALVFRDVDRAHDNIDIIAHNQIASAKTTLERNAIIAANNQAARVVAANGVEMFGAHYTYFQTTYGPEYEVLSTRLGEPMAESPPPQAPPSNGDGIAVPLDNKKPRSDALGDDPNAQKSDPNGTLAEATGAGGATQAPGSGLVDQPGAVADQPVAAAAAPAPPMPGTRPSGTPATSTPATLGGGLPGSGIPSGGLPGGGGLSSGGPLSGLSGSNPLSALTSGLGEAPGSSGVAGLPGVGAGGVPNAAAQAAQAGQPSAAFARGLAAGASAGGAVPSMTPPTASTAPPGMAGFSASPPVAGPAAAPTPASSGGVAAPGAHVPVSGGVPPSAGGPTPMLLPPPGMGGPAASGASVAPPTPAAPASGPAPSAAPAAAAASGNVGSTLVPAAHVVAAERAAAGARTAESADVAAAKALAWELVAACQLNRHPLEWAVGIFRSPAGSETVVMSNDGSGFVPAGVYLPRGVRLLVADPLVDKAFRDRWFGWDDPARVLVAYAGLRGDSAWRLVAAATSGKVDALRDARIDYGWADRDRSPLGKDWAPPGLDKLRVHRLELEYPDLYGRLQRIADVEGPFHERLMMPIAAELMEATRGAGVDCPPLLRQVWAILGADKEPSSAMWVEYANALIGFNLLEVSVKRAGFQSDSPEADVSDRKGYRAYWLMARTMEFVGGWARRPLPLADMVYAATAVGTGDFRMTLEPKLREIEEDLRT